MQKQGFPKSLKGATAEGLNELNNVYRYYLSFYKAALNKINL